MDFVNSLEVKLADLEYTEKTSYSEGISKIFINALSKLTVNERPLHCSDLKRETLYVKDEGAWAKDEEKDKITSAIRVVGI